METQTFKLSRPITTHQGEIHELKMKPPIARSFMDHGSPYSWDKDTNIIPVWPATFSFVADMTGVDTVILGSIAGEDVMPLFLKVVEMLNARPQSGSKQ